MKKIFVLTLILGVFCAAQAGYVIRGIDVNLPPHYTDLKNYTLTFRPDGVPISAASMHTTHASGMGKNTIVIIQSNTNTAYLFPIALVDVPFNDVEVRDFHYDQSNNVYVLCGSRQATLGAPCAFVAVIDAGFSSMHFMEYPATIASIFYSIGNPNPTTSVLIDYYLCGTRGGDFGVIVSVNRGTLALTNYRYTDIPWEYHKIIVKPIIGTPNTVYFIASGRTSDCTQIGFTTLNALFAPVNNYRWKQSTNPLSHCVVSNDVLAGNSVILASSYQDVVTLNPATYPLSTLVTAYHFKFPLPGFAAGNFYVQDIGTILVAPNNPRISVAGGFGRNLNMAAWHGYVGGLSATNPLTNNFYRNLYIGEYEHYKIRHQQGDDYTGGFYQRADEMGALFSTPMQLFDGCDNLPTSDIPNLEPISWSSFSLLSGSTIGTPYSIYSGQGETINFDDDCGIFKGGDPALKSVMSAENESEIVTSHDRITLKDIPANTGYQIYTIQGQLVQTGTTNPDISTASLSKGVYILRLESGKTFKFVK